MAEITSFLIISSLFFIASFICYTLLGLIILLIAKIFKKELKIKLKKLLKTTALFAAIATVLVILFTARILFNPPAIDAPPQNSIFSAIGAGFAAGIAAAFAIIFGILLSMSLSFFFVGIVLAAYIIVSTIKNKYN